MIHTKEEVHQRHGIMESTQYTNHIRKEETIIRSAFQGHYPELTYPGKKVQIDGKKVPYACLRGALRRDGKHLYHQS